MNEEEFRKNMENQKINPEYQKIMTETYTKNNAIPMPSSEHRRIEAGCCKECWYCASSLQGGNGSKCGVSCECHLKAMPSSPQPRPEWREELRKLIADHRMKKSMSDFDELIIESFIETLLADEREKIISIIDNGNGAEEYGIGERNRILSALSEKQ